MATVSEQALMMARIFREARRQGASPEKAAALATGKEEAVRTGMAIPGETPGEYTARIDVENHFDKELHRRKKETGKEQLRKPWQ